MGRTSMSVGRTWLNEPSSKRDLLEPSLVFCSSVIESGVGTEVTCLFHIESEQYTVERYIFVFRFDASLD